MLDDERVPEKRWPPVPSNTHSAANPFSSETIIEVIASLSIYQQQDPHSDAIATSVSLTTDGYGAVHTEMPTITSIPQPTGPVNISIAANVDEDVEDFTTGERAAIIIASVLGIAAIVIASIWFCCGKPRRRKIKAREEMQLHRERAEAAARADVRPLGSSVQNLVAPVPPPPPTEMIHTDPGLRQSIAPVAARGAVGRVASNVGRHVSLRGGGGSDAPPSYEEAVPATHQRLAGGVVQRGGPISFAPPVDEEDGAGMVADGKMPLSEIPFEDVVLEQQTSNSGESASSASSFHEGGRDFSSRHAQSGGDTTGHSNV